MFRIVPRTSWDWPSWGTYHLKSRVKLCLEWEVLIFFLAAWHSEIKICTDAEIPRRHGIPMRWLLCLSFIKQWKTEASLSRVESNHIPILVAMPKARIRGKQFILKFCFSNIFTWLTNDMLQVLYVCSGLQLKFQMRNKFIFNSM